MVAPITGPVGDIISWPGPVQQSGYRPTWGHRYRAGFRQRRPYNLPLEYVQEKTWIDKYVGDSYKEYYDVSAYSLRSSFDYLIDHCKVKALARFKNQLKADEATLGAALAERKQSMEMIAKRSLQFTSFVKAVKRFRFGDAAKILGLTSVPKGVRAKGRSFASNVLEYSFGWAPLANDIGNAVNTLQRGVPPMLVRATGSEKALSRFSVMEGVNTHDRVINCEWGYRYSAWVRVNNPNLWLANQLGFVNPASVVWEIVPFSFVVDYFINVQQFLGSFTDFWGVDFVNPFWTRRRLIHSVDSRYGPTTTYEQWVGTTFYVERRLGIPDNPPLVVRRPWQISPQRALTSVALLLQQLR